MPSFVLYIILYDPQVSYGSFTSVIANPTTLSDIFLLYFWFSIPSLSLITTPLSKANLYNSLSLVKYVILLHAPQSQIIPTDITPPISIVWTWPFETFGSVVL